MIKNENGISLLTVIITIVVMIILISIVVNSSINSVDETNLTKINYETKNIKDAVNIRISNHERNASAYPYVGTPVGDKVFTYVQYIEILTKEEINELIKKLTDNYNVGNEKYYRLIGKTEAEELGVDGIDIEHCYIIDYYEGDVYGPIKKDLIEKTED